jgi:ribonuclease HI
MAVDGRGDASPAHSHGGCVVNASGSEPAIRAENKWQVYLVFDGGSRGNPGAGYGSYVYKGVVSQLKPVMLNYPGTTTNNEAEYMTLINGLEAILAATRSNDKAPETLRIAVKTDSKLVVEQVSGRWKVKKAELRPLVQKAQKLLGQFKSWEMTWHPRSESVRILGH